MHDRQYMTSEQLKKTKRKLCWLIFFFFFLKLFASQRLLSCLHNAHLFSFFFFIQKWNLLHKNQKHNSNSNIFIFITNEKKTLKDKSCFNGEFLKKKKVSFWVSSIRCIRYVCVCVYAGSLPGPILYESVAATHYCIKGKQK